MALILDISQSGGTIVLHNIPQASKTALGIEDIRLIKIGVDRIEVQTEAPQTLLKSVYDIAAGELSIGGVVSGTSDIAITDFGLAIEAARSSGGGGGGGENEPVANYRTFRNDSLLIGDSNEEIVLFAFKRSGTNASMKSARLSIIIESNDFVELRYHKNPTIVGGGVLAYSSLPDSSVIQAAYGDTSSPSKTQVGVVGSNVQTFGYVDEKNYGAAIEIPIQIDLLSDSDEHVFSAICSGNDTKARPAITFNESV